MNHLLFAVYYTGNKIVWQYAKIHEIYRIVQSVLNGITINFCYCNVMALDPARCKKWVCPQLLVLMMTRKGRGTLLIRDSGAFPIDDGEHSLFLLTPDIQRHVESDPADPLEVLACGFTLEFSDGRDLFTVRRANALELAPEDRLVLQGLIRQLHASHPPANPAQKREREFLSFRLCGAVAPYLDVRATTSPEVERCRKAVEYLDLHYREETPFGELAALCDMSRTLFFREFQRETGWTPGDYRTARRIREAQKLLLGKEFSTAEIAEAVGWESVFYFTRIFKRETGLSPGEFRRRHTFG